MASDILILDGGLGTSLMYKYDTKFNDKTPLWSTHLLLEDRQTLLRCQQDFGNAPVDIILTATYQVSIGGFAKTLTERHPEGVDIATIPGYLTHAVEIAEKAKHDHAKVALSLGPYGACMQPGQEYSGKYDNEHTGVAGLQKWHQERLQLFVSIPRLEERLGYIAFETIPRLEEIVGMRRALSATPELSSIPFWMSCVYPGEELTLPTGDSVSAVVEAMLDPKITADVPWGIGINCTKVWKLDTLIRAYESAITELMKSGRISSWPALVLYPDGTSGEVWDEATKTWISSDKVLCPDPWECQVAELVTATKERSSWRQIVVGGCCMAHAEDIKRLRQQILTT